MQTGSCGRFSTTGVRSTFSQDRSSRRLPGYHPGYPHVQHQHPAPARPPALGGVGAGRLMDGPALPTVLAIHNTGVWYTRRADKLDGKPAYHRHGDSMPGPCSRKFHEGSFTCPVMLMGADQSDRRPCSSPTSAARWSPCRCHPSSSPTRARSLYRGSRRRSPILPPVSSSTRWRVAYPVLCLRHPPCSLKLSGKLHFLPGLPLINTRPDLHRRTLAGL